MTHKKRNRLLKGVVGIVIIVVVTLAFFSKIDWFIQAVTPREETFTELYFDDHLNLPKKLYRGIPFQVAFTIHNLEGKNMDYPVKIFALSDSEPPELTQILDTSVSVDKNITKTVRVQLTLPETSAPREKVVIELVDLDQSIHFWTLVATPSASPIVTPKK